VHTPPIPDLSFEIAALGSRTRVVAGCDEVGRGALAGPVSVGMVTLDRTVLTDTEQGVPAGLRDSKLLRPSAREALVPRICHWASGYAVGHASAAEIDELGILRALRLAGERAIQALVVPPDLILLDGSYDWLTRPAPVPASRVPASRMSASGAHDTSPRVELRVKADVTCASVAAASVLAKVERDRQMVELAGTYPGYGWEGNKGYGSPGHRRALREIGPCVEHRRSWQLVAPAEQGALFSTAASR
jgi:ribonuclease HII